MLTETSLIRTCLRAALIIGLTAATLTGCKEGTANLTERASIEGRANAEQDIAAQNENLRKRSVALEADLSERQRVLQGIKGTFEGTLPTENGDFRIRVTLVPNLPPYQGTRIRTPEEVVADLNFVAVSAQIVQWRPGTTLGAIGCRAEDIRPDYQRGEIAISTVNCPNLYQIRIAQEAATAVSEEEVAFQWAAQLREGKVKQVNMLSGEMQPSQAPAIYRFKAKRMPVSQ